MTLFDPEVTARDAGSMRRVRAVVAYDGRDFHGFAEQPGIRTVSGTLRAAIERVAGHPVTLTCAGRTDRGVHARGQVISFDLAESVDLDGLRRSLVKLCGPEVVVRSLEPAAADFDARFSARSRTYRYGVLNRRDPDPLLRHTTWHVSDELDPELLTLACDPFLGTHDFSAFCRRPRPATGTEEVSLVRQVTALGWRDRGHGILEAEITAAAFCHQMVRSIVGTMVAAGARRVRPGDIRTLLHSRDRNQAPPIAPPHGLCLWHVEY